MNKQLIAFLSGLILVSSVNATSYQTKLQRGAKIFMNYCSGCHSLRYVRYQRMAEDLGLTAFTGENNPMLINNLIFTHAKIADPILISMPAVDARKWFGLMPPDLSLTARSRGGSWIYNYLKSFYADKSRPFGTNNLLLADTAMPNVLGPLSGFQVIVQDDKGSSLQLKEPGELSQQQFECLLNDLVAFLVYVGEPVKLERYRIGVGVISFLLIFLLIIHQLKKLYWKNKKL